MKWYSDLWCGAEMQALDPEGCGMGLAFGYVGVPLLILAAAVFIFITSKE